jgi:hypothetical protein
VSLLLVAAIFATGHHPGALLWLPGAPIASFAISQGTLVWVHLSEICRQASRKKAEPRATFSVGYQWHGGRCVSEDRFSRGSVSISSFLEIMFGQLLLTLGGFP